MTVTENFSPTVSTSSNLVLTENCSPTFSTSSNPLVDFFFHVVPNNPSHKVPELLEAAWNEDPLTALKLVCELRGVRGTGKSEREGFYAAASWIHWRHPKTLAANVHNIAQFGYFKDLPEILVRLVQEPKPRKNARLKNSVTRKKSSVQRKMGVQNPNLDRDAESECVVLVTPAEVVIMQGRALLQEKLEIWVR